MEVILLFYSIVCGLLTLTDQALTRWQQNHMVSHHRPSHELLNDYVNLI